VRYTVAFFSIGLCYGKAIAVSTRQARRAHNKNNKADGFQPPLL